MDAVGGIENLLILRVETAKHANHRGRFVQIFGGCIKLDQFKTGHKQVIVYPPEYRDGELEYPFGK